MVALIERPLFRPPLSRREEQVFRCAALGWGTPRAAEHLGVGAETVKTQRRSIADKFRERDATMHRVVAECFRTGYLDPRDETPP